MSWFFGAGVGFLFGGPLGAMAGGVIEHLATQSTLERRSLNSNSNEEVIFVTNLAAIMTLVAMADGVIDSHEISLIHNFFAEKLGYSGLQINYVDGIIRETERTNPNLTEICRAFKNQSNMETRLLLLDITCQIAAADRKITTEEEKAINIIATYLSIPEEDIEGLKNKYFGRGKEDETPYSILGVAYNASPAEIKRAYRTMAAQYHPDKVAHLGKELIEFANKKFTEINEAYKELRDIRGI